LIRAMQAVREEVSMVRRIRRLASPIIETLLVCDLTRRRWKTRTRAMKMSMAAVYHVAREKDG
jgi:hypothetical protein